MLKVEELEKQLNQGTVQGIYLLYGEETFLLEQQLKKIKKNFGELVKGINYIAIDENNVQELIADIETPAFGYPNKLIIVLLRPIQFQDGKTVWMNYYVTDVQTVQTFVHMVQFHTK